MSQSKTWAASHSAAVNFTKLTGCGGSTRLLVGNGVNGGSSSEFRSFISFTVDWTGVGKIVSAVLQVYTDDQNSPSFGPPGTATPQAVVRRLTGPFVQGNNADGVFDASDYTAPVATPSKQAISNMAKAALGLTSIDITAIVEDAAPAGVSKRDGTPGGGLPWHGLGLQRDGASKTNGWSGWSHMYTTDTTKQPVIILTYDLAATAPAAPSSLTPTGSTTQGTFEGDFTSTDSADTLNAAEVEVYPDSATNSGQTVTGTMIWSQKSPASAAQTLAAHFILSPDNLPTVTGTPYKWRARVYANKGGVGPWTDLVEYTETNTAPNAPTLGPVDGTTVATMNGIQFTGGTFSDPDAGDVLAAYQIEMSAYPSGDAHWTDDAFLLWETGKVLTPAGATTWQRAYGGNALAAGTYYWRARVWDQREGVSAWAYASIVLSNDFDPAPGSQDTPQINPHAPWRIVLRGLKAAASVGGGTLTGAHSTSLLTTGSAHGLVAGNTIKFATLAGGTGLTTTAYYYVLAAGLTTTAFKVSLIPGTAGAVATFSSDVTSGSVVQYTRGPGDIVGILENAKSVGASIVYNSPGQLHFTLDIDHEQISVCLPRLTHYAVEFYGGDGWREVFAGLLTDFDATETSVIFQGVDYLGLFASNYDERYDPSNAELPVPTGSKYVNKTIGYVIKDQLTTAIARSNSIVGFIKVGDIAGYVNESPTPGALSEKVTIYSTFQATLPFVASLIESHKQGTGKNTRVEVVKNTDGSYSVQVVDDPGTTRSNLTLRYGELLQGYRVIPFGPSWASTQHLIGRTREGLRVFYETKSAPNIDPGTWGYWAQAQIVEDLADENDAIRRTLQAAIVAGKLGKQMGFGIRSGFLQPRDGYDVCDVLPVEIIHGAVDTTRFGDGLWVCFAIAWEAGDDGSQNVILTVLPKDDASSPDPDLIPTAPLSPQAEWQIGWAPPDPLVVAAKFFLNQTTGIGYQRNDDGTYSTIDSVGGLTYPAAPDKPTVSSVTSTVAVADDGTVHGTAVVTVAAPSTSALQQVVFVTPDSGTPIHLIVPLGATTVSLPVKPASVLSVTAYAIDTYGNVSTAADAVAHTTVKDTTAPAWSAPNATSGGLVATGAILGAILTWVSVPDLDLDHYDIAVSSDGGSTYPTVYSAKTTAITITQLAAATYYFKVRAVDSSGNASAYTTAVSATSRTAVTADITALNITTGLLAAKAVQTAKIDDLAVTSGQLGAKAVITAKIDDLAVGTGQVAATAITDTKMAAGSITVANAALADSVVATAKLAANAVTLAKLVGGMIPPRVGSGLPTLPDATNYPIGSSYFNTADSTWHKTVDGNNWILLVSAGDIVANTITAAQIAANTITAAQIASATITATQIAANAITAGKLAVGEMSNLLTDPGFEANSLSLGWTAASGGGTSAATVQSTHPHGGKYNLQLVMDATPHTLTVTNNDFIPAAPAELFALGVWAILGAGVPHFRIDLLCYDSTQSALATQSGANHTATASMAYYSDTYTTPASTAYVKVQIVGITASTLLALDDIFLSRGGVVIDSNGIAIYNGKLSIIDSDGNSAANGAGFTGAWADFIATGVYDATMQNVPTASVTLSGGAFSGAIPGSTHMGAYASHATSLAVVTDTAYPGGKKLQSYPADSSGAMWLVSEDYVPVMPGGLYMLGCQADCTIAGSDVPTLSMQVQWADYTKSALSAVSTVNVATWPATAALRTYWAGPFVAPDNARFVINLSARIQMDTAHRNASTNYSVGSLILKPFNARGMQSEAWPIGSGPYLAFASTTTMNANQANIYPVIIDAPMLLSGCAILDADTTLTRSFEWRLYSDDAVDNVTTGVYIVGALGSASWTASSKSIQVAAVTGTQVLLMPGHYWLAIRNSQGTNSLVLGAQAVGPSAYGTINVLGAYTTHGALGTTFDFSGLTAVGGTMAGVWLQGVTLGRTWG